MTITFKLKDKATVEGFMYYMNEIYEYINIPKENLPGVVEVYDDTITIFVTDEFFEYSYQFFIEQLLIGTSGGNQSNKRYLETVADYFRKGSDILLMTPVPIIK